MVLRRLTATFGSGLGLAFSFGLPLSLAALAVYVWTDPRSPGLPDSQRVLLALGIGLAGQGLAVLAGFGLAARYRRPLRLLREALARINADDLSVPVALPPGAGPEAVELAQAVNALAERAAGQRAEAAQVRASERRYRRLVELSPEALVIRRQDEIAFANLAGARLLGATEPIQLAGRCFEDFIHPEARAQARVHWERGAAAPPPAELKLLGLDGRAFEAEVSLTPLAGEDPPTAQVIIRDITERKQAEAALRESEARFRTMADSAPVLMWVARPDGQRTFFNRPWLDFTGRSLAQELDLGWADDLHPDDYQRYLDAYTAALRARQSFEVEYRLRRADGQYRWLVSIGMPHFTPDEQLAGYIGVCLDITERHAAEEALRLSRDQFAFILESAADGITAQDPLGRLRYANAAAARLFGFPSAEGLLAAAWPEILGQIDAFDEAGQPLSAERWPGQRALEGVRPAAATLRLRPRAGGEGAWVAVKATPVFNDAGQIELAVNIFQDITEQRHAGLAQRLLAEAGRLLAAPLDNAARLTDVARLAVPLLADWCALDVVDETGALGRAATAAAPAAGGQPYDLGAERVIQTGEPQLYPFVPAAVLADRADGPAPQSAMVVPLLARAGSLGALTFVQLDPRRRYGRADLALAEELARRVALVLENARLFEQAQKLNATLEERVHVRTAQLRAINTQLEREAAEREAAQRRLEESQSQLRRLSAHLQAAREAERILIAREIHDELGQVLAGLKMDVAWLRRSLGAAEPALTLKLEDMAVLIDSTVQTIRRLSAELRPSLLDDLGLAAALEWQLDEFRARTGLAGTLTVRLAAPAVESDRATALFRICQEALTNVARHAAATRVDITLEEQAGTLCLSVHDNGRGITEAEATQSKSFGLLGMRERVLLLNGTIAIQGAPGRGTWISVRLPPAPEAPP